jgi:Polyketide cyclase / dehydrase and lipid transport
MSAAVEWFAGLRPTEVELSMNAAPDRVYAVLSDGWAFDGWVVGATHIRAVDTGWPAPGTKIHHQVGSWPLLLADQTESLATEPARLLVLRAEVRPLGEAIVEITVTADGAGSSVVRIREAPSAGPGRWLNNPLLRWGLRLRNTETLRRLRDRTERRAG